MNGMGKSKHLDYPLLVIDLEDDGPISGPLRCPKCKSTWVHPISVRINPPGEHPGEVKIDADGLHIDTTKKREGIATKMILTFGCEGGHVFGIELLYCRGRTLGAALSPPEPKVGHYKILGREGDPSR
jgi:hypothetical protein